MHITLIMGYGHINYRNNYRMAFPGRSHAAPAHRAAAVAADVSIHSNNLIEENRLLATHSAGKGAGFKLI